MIRKLAYCMAAAVVLLAGCTSRKAETGGLPRLAVSIAPLQSLLQPLADGRFDVVCMMERSTDPETFEPSVGQRVAADAAKAFFMTGALPFENNLARTLPDSVAAVRLIDAIEPVYGTHGDCGHHHESHGAGEPDPHIWTSLRNASAMTREIAVRLVDIDPEGRDIYNSRADSLCALLDSLDSLTERKLSDIPARAFVVQHPSLSYFARDYGLKQIAIGMEGKEFSAAAMRDAITRARDSGARVFLIQRGTDASRMHSVCKEAGLRAVETDLLGADIYRQLNEIADEFSRQ